MTNTIELILALLGAVTALALLSRKLPIPYPILLVLGGLALALIPGLPRVRLDPELVFIFFLPPLLYPAALFMPWRDFRVNLRPILLLAVGLVLFTTVSVGFLAHYFLPEFPLAAGFALGAIVSPPDAIAATAIAEHVRIPRRVITILEGESLVNDATALVALRFAIASLATGVFSLTHAVGQFVLVCAGGIAVGLVIGYVAVWIQKHINDTPIEITLSLLTPFAAYLSAERLGVSGILAVLTTGLYFGWRMPEITTSRTRLQAGPVWQMIEFLLNGLVFLLIGLELPDVRARLPRYSIQQLLVYGGGISIVIILLRILWVFPATYLPRLLFKKLCARDPHPKWQHVAIVAWTGMRGVVSLAAALALLFPRNPSLVPVHDLVIFLTFVVILATLVVQGLTLPPLIRWLGVEEDCLVEQEERKARLKANQAALARLDQVAKSDQVSPIILQRLRDEYEDRIRQLEAFDATGDTNGNPLFSSDYEKLLRLTLKVERRTLIQLRNDDIINDETLRRIQRDIDLAEARLKSAPS